MNDSAKHSVMLLGHCASAALAERLVGSTIALRPQLFLGGVGSNASVPRQQREAGAPLFAARGGRGAHAAHGGDAQSAREGAARPAGWEADGWVARAAARMLRSGCAGGCRCVNKLGLTRTLFTLRPRVDPAGGCTSRRLARVKAVLGLHSPKRRAASARSGVAGRHRLPFRTFRRAWPGGPAGLAGGGGAAQATAAGAEVRPKAQSVCARGTGPRCGPAWLVEPPLPPFSCSRPDVARPRPSPVMPKAGKRSVPGPDAKSGRWLHFRLLAAANRARGGAAAWSVPQLVAAARAEGLLEVTAGAAHVAVTQMLLRLGLVERATTGGADVAWRLSPQARGPGRLLQAASDGLPVFRRGASSPSSTACSSLAKSRERRRSPSPVRALLAAALARGPPRV